MNWIVKLLTSVLGRPGLLKADLDYHLLRASMVVIFLFFGYQIYQSFPSCRTVASAGGFPAVTGHLVLLAVSFYLLKQDFDGVLNRPSIFDNNGSSHEGVLL